MLSAALPQVVKNLKHDETYVLHQCGTVPPVLANFGPNAKSFSIPLKAISITDTSALAFLELLGVQDRMAYITEYASSPCAQFVSTGECTAAPES